MRVNMFRRNHDLLAGKPVAGLDDQVTNRPTLVVHYGVSDMADRSSASLDVVAAKTLCASQMRIVAIVGVPAPDGLLTRHKRRRRNHGKNTRAPHATSVPVGRPDIVTIILL